jgi:1-acyl-sn-glycerol-3-phosphate acyltransferase
VNSDEFEPGTAPAVIATGAQGRTGPAGPARPQRPVKAAGAARPPRARSGPRAAPAVPPQPGPPPADPAPLAAPAPAPDPAGPDLWDRRIATGLSFLRRRLTGEYEVDEFGFDRELTDAAIHPLLRRLYRSWFRVEVLGVENLPASGPALVVGNHAGVVAVDALMLSIAVHDEHPAHRYLRLLGADLVFRMPVLSELTRKAGGTLACGPDAERLMAAGEMIGVFPEGFKGVGKLFRDRYKLQRFGRGGFVSAALRTGTPIVPVAIVGAEEIYPMLANFKPLARLIGTPYFPITPTFPWLGPLGMIPLPSKWYIRICPPISTAGLADQADDPLVIFNLADQVRETIQHTLHALLTLREQRAGG